MAGRIGFINCLKVAYMLLLTVILCFGNWYIIKWVSGQFYFCASHLSTGNFKCRDILPCTFQVFASLGFMSPSIVDKFKQNAKEEKEERNILRLLLCIYFQYVLQSIVFECSTYLSPKKKKFSLKVNHGQEDWQQSAKMSL